MSDPSFSGIDEAARRRFEAAWFAGRPEPIDAFLPPENDARYLATLEELVHIELELAWKAWRADQDTATRNGRTVLLPPRLEHYLERFPQLGRPSILARLIEQERHVREVAGDTVLPDEYSRRFPQLVTQGGVPDAVLGTMASGIPAAAETVDVARPVVPAGPSGEPARRFGNYELLEEIGRGGMGVVYRARQATADRIVALKVIRRDWLESMPAAERAAALDRFRHEAQAAARIEHENIVTVYEVGQVEGEPFFSMRYVDGRSLADLVQEGPLAPRRAAAYLEPVARAVDEAHRRGILHRDLKPQNILVDRQTDAPLVADFGLAKLLQTSDELTCAGDVMGSPPYMSPEQARDSSHVTTQSDVYALGATLYHTVSGQPPFQAASVVETLSQVMYTEPVPLHHVAPAVDRDLETICMKCLEKETARRYASAAALADDLQRYLAGEPILARPVGTLERTWRWCRRNPLAAGLLATTAFCLLVALVVSVVANVKIGAALEKETAALETAQQRHRQTRDVINKFFTRISEDRLLNEPGMQLLRKELLEEVLPYYQRFLREFRDDSSLRDELAVTHFRVGRITEAVASPQDARPWFERARAMQEHLLAEKPDDRNRQEALGDTLNALGRVLHRQSHWDEARQTYQQAIQIRSLLAQADPANHQFQRTLANSHMNLGLLEKDVGNFPEAESQLGRAQDIRQTILAENPQQAETRRDLGMGYYNQAVLASALIDPKADTPDRHMTQAEQCFRKAIGVFETLLENDPHDLGNQYRLVVCDRLLADLQSFQGKLKAAGALYEKALEHMKTLALRNPEVPDYQADLAALHMNLGWCNKDQGDPEAAREHLQQAQTVLEDLVNRHPRVARYRRDLAVALRELAVLLFQAGRTQEARDDLRAAHRHLEDLVGQWPDEPALATLLDETAALMEAWQMGPPPER